MQRQSQKSRGDAGATGWQLCRDEVLRSPAMGVVVELGEPAGMPVHWVQDRPRVGRASANKKTPIRRSALPGEAKSKEPARRRRYEKRVLPYR